MPSNVSEPAVLWSSAMTSSGREAASTVLEVSAPDVSRLLGEVRAGRKTSRYSTATLRVVARAAAAVNDLEVLARLTSDSRTSARNSSTQLLRNVLEVGPVDVLRQQIRELSSPSLFKVVQLCRFDQFSAFGDVFADRFVDGVDDAVVSDAAACVLQNVQQPDALTAVGRPGGWVFTEPLRRVVSVALRRSVDAAQRASSPSRTVLSDTLTVGVATHMVAFDEVSVSDASLVCQALGLQRSIRVGVPLGFRPGSLSVEASEMLYARLFDERGSAPTVPVAASLLADGTMVLEEVPVVCGDAQRSASCVARAASLLCVGSDPVLVRRAEALFDELLRSVSSEVVLEGVSTGALLCDELDDAVCAELAQRCSPHRLAAALALAASGERCDMLVEASAERVDAAHVAVQAAGAFGGVVDDARLQLLASAPGVVAECVVQNTCRVPKAFVEVVAARLAVEFGADESLWSVAVTLAPGFPGSLDEFVSRVRRLGAAAA